MEQNNTRYFKLMENDECIGRYTGKTPMQSAKKACNVLLRKNKDIINENGIIFSIYECTRGSEQKKYNYMCKKIKNVMGEFTIKITRVKKDFQINYEEDEDDKDKNNLKQV